MTYEEKGTWVYLVVSLGVYVAYLVYLFGQGGELTEANWVLPLLISIGAAIVAAIILRIVVEIVTPSENYRSDVRDKSISRQGDAAGNAFVIAGAIGALILAAVDADHFWIANVIYLGFVLSALLSSVVRIGLYRGAIQPW